MSKTSICCHAGVSPADKITGFPPEFRSVARRKAFEDFMTLNQYDLLIRGHQKFPEGYRVLWGNHLISLFSTSTYDGRPIGQAKFFRLTPDTFIHEIGNEATGEGKGILTVHPQFLATQLEKYYHARLS